MQLNNKPNRKCNGVESYNIKIPNINIIKDIIINAFKGFFASIKCVNFNYFLFVILIVIINNNNIIIIKNNIITPSGVIGIDCSLYISIYV